MFRTIILALIFAGCMLNWIGISVAAKSAMHETTGAVVGLSALVALAAICVCDAIREAKQAAAKHAEEQLALLLGIQAAAEKQRDLIETQTKILDLSGAVAQRTRDASAVLLKNLAANTEHTNALLKWLGELKATPPQ